MADLMASLRQADAAGDTEAANRIAGMIRAQQAEVEPVGETKEPSFSVPLPGPLGAASKLLGGTGRISLGDVEAAATIASGAIAEPAAGAAGLGTLALTQDPAAAAAVVGGVKEAITYNPRTEEGLRNLKSIADSGTIKAIGSAMESAETTLGDMGFDMAGPIGGAIGEAIPTAIMEAAGLALPAVSRAVKTAAKKIPAIPQSAKKQEIAQLISEEKGLVDTAKFKLADSEPGQVLRIEADPVANEAIKQGFREEVIAPVKFASPEDKVKMREMVDIMERGKADALYEVDNRPSQVAGDSLLDRYKFVKSVNKQAGKDIGAIARGLEGQPIDISKAANNFADDLEGFGIKLVPDKKGGFKPDFEDSALPPGDRGPIKEVIRQMSLRSRGGVDALKAHDLKQAISRIVTYGKTKTGLSRDGAEMLKDFRRDIDDSLDAKFPVYNEANTVYRDTITAIDELQDVAGRSIDLGSKGAEKQAGVLLRGLMSNIKSRNRLNNAVQELDKVAKNVGGEFTDNIKAQMLFADELDAVFGTGARTGFQGQISQALKQGSRAGTKAGAFDIFADLAGKGVEKARNISQEGAFKAIKDLLKD